MRGSSSWSPSAFGLDRDHVPGGLAGRVVEHRRLVEPHGETVARGKAMSDLAHRDVHGAGEHPDLLMERSPAVLERHPGAGRKADLDEAHRLRCARGRDVAADISG